MSFGIAPRNKTGNSKSDRIFGCLKYFCVYLLKDLSKCMLTKPFMIRMSANSVNFKLGLCTKSCIPTSYLYFASARKVLRCFELPGSNSSNQASNSFICAGISVCSPSCQKMRYEGSSLFSS